MNILPSSAGLGYTLGLVGVFAGLCLLSSGVYQLVVKPLARRREMGQRLQRSRTERLARVQILRSVQEMEGSLVAAIMQKLGAWGRIETLQRHLLQADIYMNPIKFFTLAALLGCLGFIIAFYRLGLYPALGITVLLTYAPFIVVRFKRSHKTKIIEKQMPEAMELLARSLRAGHALPSSIELASKEVPIPLGGEMKIVYEEQRLGLGLNRALQRMGERVASQDLQYFITAVLLQSETGGNLAEVMENIGYLIRERLKLKGKIQALTAEGRFSAIILAALPFVVFGALILLNRKYVDTLFREPVGYKLIGAGLVSILLGVLWMRKIIRINV